MILFNVSKRIVSEPFFSCKTPLYEIDRQMINLTCIINLACAEAATGDVLQNRCSSVFCNIHRKAPMLKSLCSVNIVKFSRTVFFIEHLRWLLLPTMTCIQNFRMFLRIMTNSISPICVPSYV